MPEESLIHPKLFLNKVHLKGYKSIEDLEIELKPGLNILIGKNGSGKSNFLEAVNDAFVPLRNGHGHLKFFGLKFRDSNNHTFDFQGERILDKPSDINRLHERNLFSLKFKIDEKLVPHNPDGKSVIEIALRQFVYYENFAFPKLIGFNLPSYLDCIDTPGKVLIPFNDMFWEMPESVGFINNLFSDLYKGNNYAPLINFNKQTILESLIIPDEIKDNLKKYSPIQNVRFNENINLYKDDKHQIIENLKIDFLINNTWLPWSHLSDGTKRLFYIISEITDHNGLVLLEEPELGIHPHQFNLLMTFLKEESQDKQIIISTHSPAALNHLSEDELNHILIAEYKNKKGTIINHLSKSQEKKAKAYMNEVGFLSDYWMLSDLE